MSSLIRQHSRSSNKAPNISQHFSTPLNKMQFITIAAFVGAASAAALEARGPTHNGVATYYTQDGNAGSCGQYHSDSDYIVAISQQAPFTYNGLSRKSMHDRGLTLTCFQPTAVRR